jgi:hypothetical protein
VNSDRYKSSILILISVLTPECLVHLVHVALNIQYICIVLSSPVLHNYINNNISVFRLDYRTQATTMIQLRRHG